MTIQNLDFGTSESNDGETLFAAFTKIQANFEELYASGGTITHAVTDVASDATCDIGAAATDRVRITGTTAITSFGTSASRLRFVHFAASLTLTYDGTSLILPGAANITTAAGDGAIFSSDASGNWRCLGYWRAAGLPVSGPGSSTDNAIARFDGVTGTIQNSTVLVSDNSDITAYDATNDGNPVFALGAAAAERLTVASIYDSGAQTLDYVLFQTDVASATADKGLFRFAPDGTAVLDIDDGGINLAASKGISIAGTDILTDVAGTATLRNIDALDATTEVTIEDAIDTLANLTSIQGRTVTLADAGANAFFGWDDGAGAYENLTKAEAQAVLGLPTSSTDNTLPRFDGTGGNLQTSGIVVDDSNNVSSMGTLGVGAITTTGLFTASLAGNTARFVNTSDSASVQVARFEGDRATMADSDEAYVSLMLSDDGGTQTEFARQTWVAVDVNAGTSVDGRLSWAVAIAGSLTSKLRLEGSALTPAANDGTALGTTALGWADLHFATGGVINWGNGEVTLSETDANTLTLAGGVLVLPDAGLQIGASVPFSDSAGTLTLQNIDALDATTEATIEAAIDTLANLTSIQGRTVTLADAGFDVLAGWDDSAGAYKNFLLADLTDEGSPAAGDYLVVYGAEGDVRKVNWNLLPGSGSLGGSTGAADNALLRADGAGGSTIQASDAILDDNENLSGLRLIAMPTIPFAGMDMPINLGLAVTAAAGALTIAIKGADGNDPSATNPVYVPFRFAGTTGTPVWATISAANSLVLSSGSTLGVTSTTAFRIWVVLFNDAGTYRLGAVNCDLGTSGIFPLAEQQMQSSTAEGGAGAADSAGVIYTGSTVSAKPYRILGYIEWDTSGVTAGTWTTTNLNALNGIVLFTPGMKKPGDIVQVAAYQTGAVATGTTTTPLDDTIPQNTEGDQYMSLAITPRSAANHLLIDTQSLLNHDASGAVNTTALHQDSTAGALSAIYGSSNASVTPHTLAHYMRANTASATTFKIRSGGHTAGTTTFNGLAAAQKYGGVINSYMRIYELMA